MAGVFAGGGGWGSDAGVPGRAAGSGPSEAGTLRGSQEKLRQPKGRPPVSRAPSAALPAGGPRTPGLKRSRNGRPPTHARPARRRAPPRLSQYLSVSRAARLRRALRVASSPPLFNGAARGAPARPDPTNRASDAQASGQPSAESSRRRPLAQAAAPTGEGSATHEPGAGSSGTQDYSLDYRCPIEIQCKLHSEFKLLSCAFKKKKRKKKNSEINNIFYLIQYVVLSSQCAANRKKKLLVRYFRVYSKFLKFSVYFTFTAHLNSN